MKRPFARGITQGMILQIGNMFVSSRVCSWGSLIITNHPKSWNAWPFGEGFSLTMTSFTYKEPADWNRSQHFCYFVDLFKKKISENTLQIGSLFPKHARWTCKLKTSVNEYIWVKWQVFVRKKVTLSHSSSRECKGIEPTNGTIPKT